MDRVQYDRGKLLKAATLGAVAAAFFIFVLINPELFASSRRGRWLTSGFVYAFLVPLMTLACLHFAWRAGSLACGSLMAVELTPTHLKLNSYGGLKLVRWADVAGARLEANMNRPQLCVATYSRGFFGGGKKIRLPLGLTNLDPAQIGALVAAIETGVGAAAPIPAAREESLSTSSTFDPNAAIARYLERKISEDTASDAPLSPTAPAMPRRPVFGRKQA